MTSEWAEARARAIAVAGVEAAVEQPAARRWLPAAATRALLVVLALLLFVIALQSIKAGARGIAPLLEGLSADGVLGHLGFGWLGSYAVMSGSPVASIALSLHAGGAASDLETFAMINGSRLGASLIVLVVGFVSYLRGGRNPDGLYIGVVALLTAMALWAPVLPIGLYVLDRGWLDGVRFGTPAGLVSAVSFVSDPVVEPLREGLPALVVAAIGVGVLVGSFALFDRALPDLERPGPRLERLSRALEQRYAMFAFGALITLVTLSVSLSVTILVPLALKGYLRRDRVVPYVMGANVATWVDTLFAAVLLGSPRAFTIVLTEMVVGALVSGAVLLLAYERYTGVILRVAHEATKSRGRLMVFAGCLFVAPLLLLLA